MAGENHPFHTLTLRDMNWTPIRKAKQVVSHYDHTILMTPLGEFIIEWKGWKTEPDYDITFRNAEWIGNENSLDAAKEKVRQYLNGKRDELVVFLSDVLLAAPGTGNKVVHLP